MQIPRTKQHDTVETSESRQRNRIKGGPGVKGRIQKSSYVKFNSENINRSQQAQFFLYQNHCKNQDFQRNLKHLVLVVKEGSRSIRRQ